MSIRKQHKRYSAPRKLFESARMAEENKLMKDYGLKNKREIWKADFAIDKIRNRAKNLITASQEKQAEFIEMLINKGLIKKGAQIDDVLALTKEAFLNRRLQTIVFKKSMSKTPKEARQLITHRHVMVKGKIVTIPSYFVSLAEEKEITLKEGKSKARKEQKEIAIPAEGEQNG